MWIKVYNLQGHSQWSRTEVFRSGYIYVSDYEMKKIKKIYAEQKSYQLDSMLPYIAIIDGIPKRLLCHITFQTWRTAHDEDIKGIISIMEKYNLNINDKGCWCFRDYDKVCFHVGDRKMSYDEFVNDFKLPKGYVFHEVFDNGFSYIGSEPFYGDNKAYADAAIRVAKKIGHLWFSWNMGYRLDDCFAIHVSYGKDEHYSEISNT